MGTGNSVGTGTSVKAVGDDGTRGADSNRADVISCEPTRAGPAGRSGAGAMGAAMSNSWEAKDVGDGTAVGTGNSDGELGGTGSRAGMTRRGASGGGAKRSSSSAIGVVGEGTRVGTGISVGELGAGISSRGAVTPTRNGTGISVAVRIGEVGTAAVGTGNSVGEETVRAREVSNAPALAGTDSVGEEGRRTTEEVTAAVGTGNSEGVAPTRMPGIFGIAGEAIKAPG